MGCATVHSVLERHSSGRGSISNQFQRTTEEILVRDSAPPASSLFHSSSHARGWGRMGWLITRPHGPSLRQWIPRGYLKGLLFYFNQLIKIYIAPLQGPYSEALPTQAKRERTVLRRWWNCVAYRHCLGGALDGFFAPTAMCIAGLDLTKES